MFSALISVSYIFLGTIALWTGIMFINGTLLPDTLATAYSKITSPIWRMLIILPVLGVGHLLFSLALNVNPVVASPTGIIFTIIPPTIYALWLLGVFPNGKIVLLVIGLILLAVLLGFELNKLG